MQVDISTQKRYSEFRLQQGRKGSGAMSRKIDKFRGEYYFLSNFYPAHVEMEVRSELQKEMMKAKQYTIER